MILHDHRDFVFKIYIGISRATLSKRAVSSANASHCALAPPQTPLTGVWHWRKVAYDFLVRSWPQREAPPRSTLAELCGSYDAGVWRAADRAIEEGYVLGAFRGEAEGESQEGLFYTNIKKRGFRPLLFVVDRGIEPLKTKTNKRKLKHWISNIYKCFIFSFVFLKCLFLPLGC